MIKTAQNDILSLELKVDVAMICASEQESLAHRIRTNTEVLWELLQRVRLTTISDDDITRGCAICSYLELLLEEYCESTQSERLRSDELFFAKAVCLGWHDLCF